MFVSAWNGDLRECLLVGEHLTIDFWGAQQILIFVFTEVKDLIQDHAREGQKWHKSQEVKQEQGTMHMARHRIAMLSLAVEPTLFSHFAVFVLGLLVLLGEKPHHWWMAELSFDTVSVAC